MGRSARVLIVDQNAQRRFEVKQTVRQAGFEVAGDVGFGAAAVSLARETKPDVVMCAIERLAGRSAQTVRSLIEALPDTPLVVYSADARLDVAQQAMRLGARDFLTLPLMHDEVMKSLLAALESEERRQKRGDGSADSNPSGLVITVFGPKGGIGKTTITTNLSAHIASTGQSVVCVDADAGFGDIGSMLNLAPDVTISDMVAGIESVTRETLSRYLTQHESGLMVLAAPLQPLDWRRIPVDTFQRILDMLARSFDVVLIDTSGILDEWTLAALQTSSLVLWITTTEYSSVRDSKSAFDILLGMGFPMERIRLIVNESSPAADVRASTIADSLGHEIFWRLPYDAGLRRSSQVGRSVIEMRPNSKIAQNFADLARLITGSAEEPRKRAISRFGFGFKRKGAKEPVITTALKGEEP